MKKLLQNLRGLRPRSPGERITLISSAILLVCSAGLFVIYSVTKYLPFALTAMILLPGTLQAVLFTSGRPGEDGRTLRHPLLFCILSGAVFAALQALFVLLLRRMTSVYTLSFVYAVAAAALFVVLVVIEKWCLHAASGGGRDASLLRNARSASSCVRLAVILLLPVTVMKLLGFYDLTKYLVYALAGIFWYVSLFVLLSFAARAVRGELYASPDIAVPVPFSGSGDLKILSYLENSTGLSMRSLWSVKLIKRLLPAMAVCIVLTVWLSTGVVRIESYESGAHYRCGILLEETLGPGLHFTLPAPFDRVEKYETGTVRKMTVGYRSESNSDNTWTEAHGTDEFKLLLGGGNELVSINLRIEYRISDLMKYLSCSASPEKLLEAAAYEQITSTTITTDLNTLLSIDRHEFADTFASGLAARMESFDPGSGIRGLGIEIVSVVLESIHPPVNVAGKYQELISAGITAEKMLLQAEGYAARTVAEANAGYDTAVNAANADMYTRIAAAESDVSGFMASVAADTEYGPTYRYYKYLDSISAAYGRARLILVGDGVDGSSIYLGGLPVG